MTRSCTSPVIRNASRVRPTAARTTIGAAGGVNLSQKSFHSVQSPVLIRKHFKLEIDMHYLPKAMQYRHGCATRRPAGNNLFAPYSFCSLKTLIVCLSSTEKGILQQACVKRSHAGIVFTQWSKNRFFTPQGLHVSQINAKFHVYRGRSVGIQPPKQSNFRILAINLPLSGHSFAPFL